MHSTLENSYNQPYLIFAYSSYCPACFAIESQWNEAVKDVEPLGKFSTWILVTVQTFVGYGIGTVNAMFDSNLLEKLRVNRVPSLLILIEGRAIHYRGNYQNLNAREIRLFARDAIPKTFMHRINTYNALKRFLDQWESTNKVSLMLLLKRQFKIYVLAIFTLLGCYKRAEITLPVGCNEILSLPSLCLHPLKWPVCWPDWNEKRFGHLLY